MIDVDDLKINNSEISLKVDSKPVVDSMIDKRFLKGPIPLWWLIRAAQLPGKSITIALAIWFLRGVKQSNRFKLSTKLLREFNVSRSTLYRGISHLEDAGLINVERYTGQNYVVTINVTC